MYKAIEKTGYKKTTLIGHGTEYKYWAVEDKSGMYANITDEIVADEAFTAEEFATVLAYALNKKLPTSAMGGMTTEQYESAKAHMQARA